MTSQRSHDSSKTLISTDFHKEYKRKQNEKEREENPAHVVFSG